MKVNYITNLPPGQTRGGWDGMNAAVHFELSRHFDVQYVGPIKPEAPLLPRIRARIAGWAGLPETAHFFSQKRLSEYAAAATRGCDANADLDFFHGCTPWVLTQPERPYFAYIDAPFHTYASLYHRSVIDPREISRISHLEARWMRAAAAIFFSSAWAMKEATKLTGGSDINFHVVGLGGGIAPPPRDSYAGAKKFIAVTTDFQRKGGPVSLEAFKLVRRKCHEVSLDFIGVRPPPSALAVPGVRYLGYLDKTNRADLEIYVSALSSALASLLPTVADTTPILIPEAGYFGCPTIASDVFGIPELIEDRHTGLLLTPPVSAMSLAGAMEFLLDRNDQYLRMRSNARALALNKFGWTQVGNRLYAQICATLMRDPKIDASS